MSGNGPPVIAVCGAGRADATLAARAEQVGALLARAGAVLVCGGLAGVMAAAARGARAAGGLTVGLLPGDDPAAANPWIALPLATGMGEARNLLLVRVADAVIAIGGEWGTLSEVALARKLGKPVLLLDPSPLTASLGLDTLTDPEAAVAAALACAGAGRPPWAG